MLSTSVYLEVGQILWEPFEERRMGLEMMTDVGEQPPRPRFFCPSMAASRWKWL